jgi:hypothetical protein
MAWPYGQSTVAFDDTKLELLRHATLAVQYHYYGDRNGNDTRTGSDANNVRQQSWGGSMDVFAIYTIH